MLRMEIALILVVAFVAYMYFSAERKHSPLHRTYSMLLIATLVNLVFDAITVYSVNNLQTVPTLLNGIFHRIFIGSMICVFFLYYQYIAILVEEETGKPRKLDLAARIYLIAAEISSIFLPFYYVVTPDGNYSYGILISACFVSDAFYFFLGTGLLIANWKNIERKKKFAIAIASIVECVGFALQAINPSWLTSGMGITLITLAFYLILENPDILRAELTEQKMSMLYLKSQVNPHFLYNTLDTIRIQAQLNGDAKVADLLMKLVDFFRLSVKVNCQMVSLDDETELLEAYMELMCYRYPELNYTCVIDPDLFGVQVPNFILQPIVENSLLHGLKNKGYQGEVTVSAEKTADGNIEICVKDTGSGFADGKKAMIDDMLQNYAKQKANLNGNSIGILNVQKRIKLLCGREFGLWYTENDGDGVTAHILLPLQEEAK